MARFVVERPVDMPDGVSKILHGGPKRQKVCLLVGRESLVESRSYRS